MHIVVVNVLQNINVITGGTLPVLKNEIGDFFFARLGTGSSIVTPFVVTYASRYNAYKNSHKKIPWRHIVPKVFLLYISSKLFAKMDEKGVVQTPLE